jgi:anti-anti-sigma factor
MNGNFNSSSSTYYISLENSFDFANHQTFRTCVKEAIASKAKRIAIDFKQTDYIDSSALGMLMLAKNETESLDCTIDLENVHGYPLKMLGMVKFDKLFNIKSAE